MDTVVTTVVIMLDSNRAHATFASFSLDVLRDVTPRAKQQLAPVFTEAGARTAVLHADVFVILAVFDEHHFTRPILT
jgi:hypothetical protein